MMPDEHGYYAGLNDHWQDHERRIGSLEVWRGRAEGALAFGAVVLASAISISGVLVAVIALYNR